MATTRDGITAVKGEAIDFSKYIRVPDKFAYLNHLILQDLNKVNTNTPTFALYSKDQIARYLSNPYRYQKQLRKAVDYIYGASPHFRRVIQYFVGLSDLAYVVAPYKIDPKKASDRIVSINYRKVLNLLSSMSIKTQFPKILAVCLKEDVFYGTLWVTADNVTVQQLPSDYCDISSIEGNVYQVSFDFSYFDTRADSLQWFPEEFRRKYELYKREMLTYRWQELDSPTSFAIKCNAEIPAYAIPPFAGVLREVYELEDYRQLKLSKTALENYAMLVMNLPLSPDGSWGIDLEKARDFWGNLDSVLPEEVGSVLSPMKVDKISFEKSNTGDVDTIADAEQNLFTAAGVSSLLFNNPKASANALLLSIKADQAITYGIVKSIEDMLNRFIQAQSYGKNFTVTFLDVSRFNRDESGDMYLKACQYGVPMISYYCASQGLGQAEIDSMSYLETKILGLQNMFKPIRNSAQIGSDEVQGEPGRPALDDDELSDSGEQTREDSDDWG